MSDELKWLKDFYKYKEKSHKPINLTQGGIKMAKKVKKVKKPKKK